MQQIGESRDAWSWDVWRLAEEFANNMKSEVKPFYIVYACKPDIKHAGAFRQTIKAYYSRPKPILGILVWFVNHPLGEFRFVPELSSPPDVPLDPALLSGKSEDFSARVAKQGENFRVLVS